MSLARVWALLGVLAAASACSTAAPTTRVPPATTASVPAPRAPIPAGDYPVLVESEHTRLEFDAEGRQTTTHTLRYRVRAMDGLGAWSTVGTTYSPWFQARPEVRATVTRPNGAIFELDPATISELPVESGQAGLYTDRKRLEAPLPGLAPGATVEQTIVVADERPFLRGGSVARVGLGTGAPVPRSVLEVLVPADSPLTYQVRGLAIEPDTRTEAGRRVLTFTAENLAPQGPTRMLLPPEHPRHPHVLLSTVPSWASAAEAYHGLVEGQLTGADVSALVKGLEPGASRDDRIKTLLSRLHGEIRYAGLELGEQAILPRRPEETLGRRFGDCKDKGVLLIALLRAVGIEAHLAVLRSGLDEDVPAEVPGLELFNHAIVYVPGPEPMWIDATQDLLPAGTLPSVVQGRHALIVAADGPGLVRTPESKAPDNHYVEMRSVRFADWGPVSVTERTEATGTMEHRLRRQLLGAGRSQVRKSLARYIERAYRAERVGNFRYGEVRDVDTPFAVEVEAVGAKVGYTSGRDGKIQLRTPVLFGFVPDLLRDAALGTVDPSDRERRAAAALVKTRTMDLVWPHAFEAEVRYRLELPEGFEPKAVPKPVQIPLGPGAYTYEVEAAEDGSLWANFALRTGKRRYSADEARAFVAGLAEVWELPVPTLELVHTGARLMAAGKPKAAIAVYRKWAKAQPKSSFHRARFAEALLDVGLGAAAREEAKQAVLLAPDSGPERMVLGRVLEADVLGRRHAPGFDRAGALAAYRAVAELDPKHIGARLAAARLQEIDERGRRMQDPEGWKAAADAYRDLRDRTGDTEFDARLMLALYWGEDMEALHALASRLDVNAPNVAMQLVAAAKLRGAEAAMRELRDSGLTSDARQEALETAAMSLARLRAYEASRALTRAALPTAKDPLQLQRRLTTLADVEPVPEAELTGRTPEDAVRRLLFAMLDPPLVIDRVKDLFSARALDPDDPGGDLARLTAGLGVFSRSAQRAEVPMAMVRDNLLSLTRFDKVGDRRSGYRVKGTMMLGSGQRESTWYVTYERGRYRVRAAESSPAALGQEALHLLKNKDVPGARRWLEWAEELMGGRVSPDALVELPFITLRRAKAPLAVQAAALVAIGAEAKVALPYLKSAERSVKTVDAKTAARYAYWMALRRADRHKEAAEISEDLFGALPDSGPAFWLRCEGLVAAGRYAEAEKLIAKRRVHKRDDTGILGCASEIALGRGDVKAARKRLAEQAEKGGPDAVVLNNLAWLSLFEGKVTDADVDAAIRSNAMTSFEDPGKLHTLAALYAERGETRQAHQVLLKRLDLRAGRGLDHVDWYLVGRIMEHFGLIEQAKAAYGRVEPESRTADSTHRLAQTRLEELGAR